MPVTERLIFIAWVLVFDAAVVAGYIWGCHHFGVTP